MNDLQRAKSLFSSGGYSCVLVKGEEVVTSEKSGIAPLLEFIESGKDYGGFSAADKIVGKAAALLYTHMGVTAVYAEVLSVPAQKILKENGIEFEYSTLTEKIINRRGDGLCPMELAVAETNDPEQALKILKEKVRRL